MSRSIQRLFLLGGAGFTSAFFSMSTESLFPVLGFLYPGLIFGIAVAGVFGLHGGVRSPLRLIGFVAASAAAFPISVYGALWTTPFVRDLWPGYSDWAKSAVVPLPSIFIAGVIGAFIIFLSAFLALATVNVSLHGVVRPACLALGGGVLGTIGWVSAGAGQSPQNLLKSAALYVIWQTGVALCIPFVAPEEERPGSSGGLAPRSMALKVITATFFGAILAFLGWQIYGTFRGARNLAHQQALRQAIVKEAPPAEGLLPVQAVACDQAIIKEDLAGFFAQQPLTMKIPARPTGAGWAAVPAYVNCTIQYSRTNLEPFGYGGLSVSIEQFPNQAWARYQAKYPSASSGILNSFPIVSKFGNRIYSNASMWSGQGGALFFDWPSGANTITISCQTTASANEEFVRRYLEKYPSSL
ncbi:MAG: hypothetical protein ACLPWF_10025 [Bryobacteraceae bacterium]